MSQQLQKECFVCHQQVYLSKPSPDSKWVKTNLDGSEHIDPQTPRKSYSTGQTTIQSTERQHAIQEAHDENMESARALKESIDNLNTTLSTLSDRIIMWLESQTT